MKKINISYLWLAFAVVSFSLYEVISKTINNDISAIQLTAIRFFIGGIVLMPFAISSIRKQKIKLGIKDFGMIAALAFLNVCFSMLVIQIGLKYTQANISAIIISSNPMFVALFSAFILKERLSRSKVIGLLVGITGVVIAIGHQQSVIEDGFVLGLCLQILGMMAFSLFTVLGKKTVLKVGSLTFNALAAVMGSVMLFPIAVILGQNPMMVDISGIWPQMIYFCVINSGLAFYSYFKALEKLDTSLGSMTFFVKPVLASVFAAFFLGEPLTASLAVGLCLILIGIYMVKKDMAKAQVKEIVSKDVY